MKKHPAFGLTGFLFLWSYGCYTALVHPPVAEWDGDRPSARDDCSACHEQAFARTAILPAAAETDEDWLFYSAEPWWRDEVDIGNATADDYIEPTGPRTVGSVLVPEAAPTMPIAQPTVQTLSKSPAEESQSQQNGEPDNRRTFQRRRDAASEKEENGNESSRSRRKN